ncbi:hypothetical protein CFI11_16580 [Thalassococcus sp. S3]|nr:hypothetical protein CFI11_16580 [Thalassococcus sp. S3]
MLSTFLSPEFAPFTLALALLAGLFTLELIFALLGGTLMGGEAEIDGIDAAEMDVADLELGVETAELDLGEYEVPAVIEEGVESEPDFAGGTLAWLGIGKAPFILWLASLLMGFGLSGVVAQSMAITALGSPLPVWLAVLGAAVLGVGFASRFAALFARVLPKTETSAVSRNRLARRRGIVSQGVARRGQAAEVRVTDFYGNMHYIRAEPLQDETEIITGVEVLVLRHRPSGGYRLIPLSD